ncbi:hypothetical protein AX17_002674 [Amanita inopinata Kibby_2008]|nr:hypothetical protein AX17_002674 [Amanita inopinata Kibby_2008]
MRSKTIMGRKLRSMTVEKGLLRETKIVQRMIDALVECRFYLDNLQDELTITALGMLVKDLLILIQAGNEGVVNVLEHYFEMSHVDATRALELYRHFCKQTEFVDEYLGVAKKLQNLLNVPIPDLKHAPVQLAGALQEYLEDPNFEQNRIQYKAAKAASERPTKEIPALKKPAEGDDSAQHKPSQPSASSTRSETAIKPDNENIIDFFAAIEGEHPNAQSNNPAIGLNQRLGPPQPNPFLHLVSSNFQQIPQFTGQPTTYLLPQQTASQQQSNVFGAPNFQQPTGHRPFSSFLQSQATGFPQVPQQTGISQAQLQQPQSTSLMQLQQPQSPPLSYPQLQSQQTGFLQPQATGANPFRQTMLFPQSTGMAMFGVGVGSPSGQTSSNPFGTLNVAQPASQPLFNSASQSAGPISTFPASISANASIGQSLSFGQVNPNSNIPVRPASTPLTSSGRAATSITSPAQTQPVRTHQTGSKNPFGPIITTPPPVPKAPTLMELAMGVNRNGLATEVSAGQQQQQLPQVANATGTFLFNSSTLNPGATDMSGVASSFSFSKTGSGPSQSAATLPSPTMTASSLFSSSLSAQPTGTTLTSPSTFSSTPTGLQPVKSHLTGFSGLKPFKPTSSFGAALLESLPPVSDNIPAGNGSATMPSTLSAPATGPFGVTSQQTGLGAPNFLTTTAFGGMRSTTGQGLRPQVTGGASNPFRATMLVPSTTGPPNFALGGVTNSTTPSFAGLGVPSTGSHLFGPGGSGFTANLANYPAQPQQQQSHSLI